MKKMLLLYLLCCLLLACACGPSRRRAPLPRPDDFRNILRLPATPPKEQGPWPAGWIYATLGLLESERLRVGDSVRLSATHLVRMRCEELLDESRRAGGRYIKTPDFAATPLHCIDLLERHGALLHATFRPRLQTSWTALRSCLNARSLRACDDRMRHVLDTTFSFLPRAVALYGAVYTPHELLRSVLREGDLQALRTPLLAWDTDARPDSLLPESLQERYEEVSLEKIPALMLSTLRAGHSLVWLGDTVGTTFSTSHAIALDTATRAPACLPRPVSAMQALHVVGLARLASAPSGETADSSDLWFVALLPQETPAGREKHFYLSARYAARHTAALLRLKPVHP